MGKDNKKNRENTHHLILGAFKGLCWNIAKTIASLLCLIGLAIAIPTLIAADSLFEWINKK